MALISYRTPPGAQLGIPPAPASDPLVQYLTFPRLMSLTQRQLRSLRGQWRGQGKKKALSIMPAQAGAQEMLPLILRALRPLW